MVKGLTAALLVLVLGGAVATSAWADLPPRPEITSISPNHGPRSGGTIVTITGTGFTGVTGVSFSYIEAQDLTVNSDTEITVVAPEPVWGLAEGHEVTEITVTGPGGSSWEGWVARFAYGPVVERLKPDFGPATGGSSVTLVGFNLEETSAVNFGSTPAESFTVNSDGSVTAIAPPRVPGGTMVPVTATTPEGVTKDFWRQEIYPSNYFTYGPTVTRVIPNGGPEAGAGSTVTIVGAGFDSPLFRCLCGPFVYSVSFGEAEITCGWPFGAASPRCSPIEFEVISDHEITATIPPGTGTVPVAVDAWGGTSPPDPEAQFTYPPERSPLGPEETQPQELMSCVVSKGSGARASSVCSSRSFFAWEEPGLPSGPVKADLYRGDVLYAKGTARVHRRTAQLFLKPLRQVRGGRYELVLSRRAMDSGRRWSRRESVVFH